eukprot:4620991-Ditylum_brightwellii.AAC.1
MVDTLQKMLLSKDKDETQPVLTESMEECIQHAIATQLEKLIPAIVEATAKHLKHNKLLDKTISTTIGTTVSIITGKNSTKVTHENTEGNKNSTKDVTQTPDQDPPPKENDKTAPKEVLLQRHISARMRVQAEKEKEDKEQKLVAFAEEPPDTGGIRQE